jgi:hypothetical protein
MPAAGHKNHFILVLYAFQHPLSGAVVSTMQPLFGVYRRLWGAGEETARGWEDGVRG